MICITERIRNESHRCIVSSDGSKEMQIKNKMFWNCFVACPNATQRSVLFQDDALATFLLKHCKLCDCMKACICIAFVFGPLYVHAIYKWPLCRLTICIFLNVLITWMYCGSFQTLIEFNIFSSNSLYECGECNSELNSEIRGSVTGMIHFNVIIHNVYHKKEPFLIYLIFLWW